MIKICLKFKIVLNNKNNIKYVTFFKKKEYLLHTKENIQVKRQSRT